MHIIKDQTTMCPNCQFPSIISEISRFDYFDECIQELQSLISLFSYFILTIEEVTLENNKKIDCF